MLRAESQRLLLWRWACLLASHGHIGSGSCSRILSSRLADAPHFSPASATPFPSHFPGRPPGAADASGYYGYCPPGTAFGVNSACPSGFLACVTSSPPPALPPPRLSPPPLQPSPSSGRPPPPLLRPPPPLLRPPPTTVTAPTGGQGLNPASTDSSSAATTPADLPFAVANFTASFSTNVASSLTGFAAHQIGPCITRFLNIPQPFRLYTRVGVVASQCTGASPYVCPMTFTVHGPNAATFTRALLSQPQQAYASCMAGIGNIPAWTALTTVVPSPPPAPPAPAPAPPPVGNWAGQRRVAVTLNGFSYDTFTAAFGYTLAFQQGLATLVGIPPNMIVISPGFTGTATSVTLNFFINGPSTALARSYGTAIVGTLFDATGTATRQLLTTWQGLGLPVSSATTPVAATGRRSLAGADVRAGANDAGTDSSSAATVPATSSATSVVYLTATFSSNSAASSLGSWAIHNLGAWVAGWLVKSPQGRGGN